MNLRWVLAFCLIAAGALALRTVRLDRRPMHNDEAVNAVKLSTHWKAERYRYDPNEHHGPTLYYSSLLPVWLSGTDGYPELRETTMRLTPALYGVGLVILLWPLRKGLGAGATLVAALLTALSPAMLFYSRNYIHEMLLVFFTLLAGVGGWRYAQGRGVGWAILAGAGVGLMYATKETFVFCGVAALGALVLTAWMEGNVPALRRLGAAVPPRHLLAGVLSAAAVSQALFTSFLTNWSGPLDSLRTYLPWIERAGGESPHIHPWWFYLERLAFFHRPKGPVWSEGWILALAGVGMVAALKGGLLGDTDRRLARFLTFYTLGLTLIYCLISYKTPWCFLGFLHGYVLLAGIGALALWQATRRKSFKLGLAALLLVATAHLAWQAWQASFVRYADWRNPYVYAQTVPDMLRLVDQVQKLARVHPDGARMLVKVIAPDDGYWPLPYYWRALERVGWYSSFPEDPYAPVVVADAELQARLDDASGRRWLMAGLFELRPRVFLELYVEFDLWRKWIEARGPIPPEE